MPSRGWNVKGHSYGGVPCQKCGQVHVSGMKGNTHTKEARAKISRALKGRRLSEEHKRKLREVMNVVNKSREKRQQAGVIIKEQHRLRRLKNVRKFYGFPDDVVFFPTSLYEHKFAREVLIEHRYRRGFYSFNGLLEHPIM